MVGHEPWLLQQLHSYIAVECFNHALAHQHLHCIVCSICVNVRSEKTTFKSVCSCHYENSSF